MADVLHLNKMLTVTISAYMNRCVTLNNIKQLHFHIGYKPYSRGIVQYVVCRVCILHTSISAYQHMHICTYAHMHICTRDWQKYTALSVYHIPRYLYRPYTGFPNICSNRLPTVEAGTVTTYRVGGGGRKPPALSYGTIDTLYVHILLFYF